MHSKNIYHELTSLVSLLKSRCKFYCERRDGGTGKASVNPGQNIFMQINTNLPKIYNKIFRIKGHVGGKNYQKRIRFPPVLFRTLEYLPKFQPT